MSTRERVLELRRQGLSLTAIARALGLNKSTVAYHVRRLGEAPDPKFNRRYDWAEIQRFYDAGHTVRECLEHFGCSSKTFADACKRGVMKTRGRAMPIEQLLLGRRNRLNLKLRLVAAGLMTNACYACGISEWRGPPLSLALHHVNCRAPPTSRRPRRRPR